VERLSVMAIVKSHIPWAVKIDAFPEQSNTLTYNTFVQSPTWRNVDFTQIEDVGGTDSATNAGTYYKLFKPLRKFVFPNGTKKVYYAPWTIYKATQQVILSETSGEVKIKFTRKFTVSRLGDGVISATSSNPNIAAVSVIGNVVTITGVSVGDVTITVNVAEGTNHLATSATYSCQSRKTQITIPTVTNTTKAFTGKAQSPTITNAPSTSLVTRTGTVSATAYSPNPYSFTYAINDTSAYEWTDGTTANKTFYWYINKKVFALPVQSGTLYYNDGDIVTPKWNFGNTDLITVTYPQESGNAGTYPAYFHLEDIVNSQWADGSTDDKTANYVVSKAKVPVPYQKGSLTYDDGYSLEPEWYNFDEDLMTIGGTTSAKNAGTYNATFTLKDTLNRIWQDGVTSANHTAEWKVDKKAVNKPYFLSWYGGYTYYSMDYDGYDYNI